MAYTINPTMVPYITDIEIEQASESDDNHQKQRGNRKRPLHKGGLNTDDQP